MTFREPLLLPAAGLLTGAVVSQSGWSTVAEGWVLASVAMALFVPRLPAWLRGSLMLVAACGIGALVEQARRPGPAPVIEHPPNETVALKGCVVEPLVEAEGRARFTVELQPGARAQATLYPQEGQTAPRLRYGQRVRFFARIRVPDRFQNPGSFDYPRYLARRRVFWLANVSAGRPIEIEPGPCGSRFDAWVSHTRRALLDRIETLYAGSAYRTGMMQALLLGDSQKVQQIWTEDFRRTGTFHALVISGQHVAVLSAVFLFGIGRLLRRPLLACAVAASVAWIYALLAGASAPAARSAAGLSIFLFARLFHREGRLLNALAAVTIAFVIVDPGQIFEASFQLSFLAVAAIGGLAAPILDHHVTPFRQGLTAISEPDRDLPLDPRVQSFRVELRLAAETLRLWTALPGRACLGLIRIATGIFLFLAETLVLSALIQAALALPSVLYFHRISLTGLSANLLIVPLLSVAVPAGFGAVLFSSSWLASAAGWLLEASRAVAAWHVPWEPAWRIPDPPAWLAWTLAACTLGWCFALRRQRWALLPAAGVTAALAAMIAHPFEPRAVSGWLELSAVDVGQGDGLFLTTPGRSLIAIDAGGFPGFGQNGQYLERRAVRMDIGEDVISPYLWTRSVKRLDVIVLTHAHTDHIGGLPALIENFRPREIWIGLMPPANDAWREVRALASRLGIRVRAPRAGEQWTFGGAGFVALAPYPDEEPGAEPHNNDSLVLLVEHGRHRFLLTGDVESKVEGRIAADWRYGPVDVLKVGHHGSRTSTSEALLDATRPSFALLSCGRNNTFRHPNSRVMQRLESRGIPVFRTDREGLVTVRSDGRYLHWGSASDGPRTLPPF